MCHLYNDVNFNLVLVEIVEQQCVCCEVKLTLQLPQTSEQLWGKWHSMYQILHKMAVEYSQHIATMEQQ